MTLLPAGVKVHLAFGYTDMRKRMDGSASPGGAAAGSIHGSPLRLSRTQGNLIKIVFWDGMGLCLFTKRLEQVVFLWPSNVESERTLALTSAQLSALF